MGARGRAARIAALALGLVCVSGAAATTAWGDTYCVADSACVTGGGTSEPDVQSALDAAIGHAGDDRVQIGPGTFQAAGPGGFAYAAPAGNTVQLVGAGSAQTTLTAPDITGVLGIITLDLEMASGGGSTVSDLAVTLPAVASGSGQSLGIFAKGADMDRIAVTTPPSVNTATGVSFETGTLQDSSVSVPLDLGGAPAVRVNDGQSGTIADSTLSGYYGIYGDDTLVSPTTITAQRDRIQASKAGIYTAGSTLTAEDTLIRSSDRGVDALTRAGKDATATLRNLTITGDPIFGLYVEGANTGQTATINLDSSIIDTEFNSIFRDASGGGTSIVNATYSNYNTSTAGIGTGSLNETSVTHLPDPKFVDSANQDYELRFDSPLLDIGNPTNSGGSSDLGGLTRVVNDRLDLGAFEYQRRPPSAVATVTLIAVETGQPVIFDAAGSDDPDPGDPITYEWAFDDGATSSDAIVPHAFTTPGNHSATLTVTDPTGLQATASTTVMVTASPLAGGPTGQRAAALKKCKKKRSAKARKKCRKRAKRLPL